MPRREHVADEPAAKLLGIRIADDGHGSAMHRDRYPCFADGPRLFRLDMPRGVGPQLFTGPERSHWHQLM